MRNLALLVCPLAIVLTLGCGGGSDKFKAQRPKTVLAQGVVTYNGEPLAGAIVIFVPPTGGTAASSATNAAGQFDAKAFPPDPGAVPGTYKVTVTKNAPMPEAPSTPASHDSPAIPEAKPVSLVPAKYTDAKKTPLTVTLDEKGNTDIKLELKAD